VEENAYQVYLYKEDCCEGGQMIAEVDQIIEEQE
jgi:hypothetical protein